LKGAAKRAVRPAGSHYDLIYCAGLFDYLSDKICAKLLEYFYDALAPGGLLIATNVDIHPSRGEMECFLEWHLVYRSSAQLAALAPRDVPPDSLSLKQDFTGVNIFMEIRKPNGEP
jgi:extracellular factor (EF) 3-hydroxypalmitic acid methyl ester biosynthesis protein